MTTKRKLTKKEVSSIVKLIPKRLGIPKAVSNALCLKQRKRLRDQLFAVEIEPECIDDLRDKIIAYHHQAQCAPGESVGVICGQAVGERQTQLTLNSFHFAGMNVSMVSTGVPRFTEIIDAVNAPLKSACVVYTKKIHESIPDIRQDIARELVGKKLGDFVVDFNIVKKPDPKPWYPIYDKIYSQEYKKHNDLCLTLHFNLALMYRHSTTLDHMKSRIEKFSDLYCVISPLSEAQMDIYVDKSHIELDGYAGIRESEKIWVYMSQVCYPEVLKVQVCGIPAITKMYYKKYETGGKKKKEAWRIETQGTDLRRVMSIPQVDTTRTWSTNMHEIYDCFGVGATREFLIRELMQVVSSDGTAVNKRHVQLLADFMTCQGTITAITRNGTKSRSQEFLSRAAFEEVMSNLLNAGVNGQSDNIEGLAASLIMGNVGHFGTGMCDLVADMSKLGL